MILDTCLVLSVSSTRTFESIYSTDEHRHVRSQLVRLENTLYIVKNLRRTNIDCNFAISFPGDREKACHKTTSDTSSATLAFRRLVVKASLNEKKKTKKLAEELEGSLSIPICSENQLAALPLVNYLN